VRKEILLVFICSLQAVQLFGQEKSYDASTEFMRFNSNWIEFRRRAIRKIAPADEIESRHRAFLAKKKTGIIRLVNPGNCLSDIKVHPSTGYRGLEKLLRECPVKFIGGEAASYSFRSLDYVPAYKADIEVKDGIMFSTGLLNQTIFVDLGNVDLDNIDLASQGLRFLTSFVPSRRDTEAAEQSEELRKGIAENDLTYRNFLRLTENHTYVLRSIAYRGKVLVSSSTGIRYEYNKLQDDTRKDVIVAFRVSKIEPDKSIILLWKELERKDSPKMEFTN
jgi:hypothetical protein